MATTETLSVLVADDMPMIRKMVKTIFTFGKYAQVVGEAVNGQEAIEAANNLKPDIILMDIDMPILNGIEAAKIIHEQDRNIKIVMLTACTNEMFIFSSFAAGADGYIFKDKFQDTIEAAMTTVRLGSVWLDPAIARRILEIAATGANTKSGISVGEPLTTREKEILMEVSNCTGIGCLVEPEFIANLRRLTPDN